MPDTSPGSARDRILTASLELMRRNGYAGTGIKAILSASGVPYGSLYHAFPGGKEEVGVETIREGGRVYLALVEAFYTPDADLVDATTAFFEGAADFVASTEYADACPIATIAGEIASTSEPMRQAAAEAFTCWLDAIEARFEGAGLPAPRAHELAVELFSAVEGAFLLARTVRDAEPIRIAGRAMASTMGDALTAAAEPAKVSRRRT